MAVDSPRTQLGFPEISLGIMPGYGGTGRAVRRIGVAHTLEMVLTGRMVRATEALEWGLVDALVGGEDMLRGALKDMLTLAAPEPVQETADDITAAFATVAFVAFISLLVDRTYTATQYALLASVGTAGRTTLASSSGALVDWLNGDWGTFFVLTTIMVIPSLLFLWLIKNKIKFGAK